MIEYSDSETISVDQFVGLLKRSLLSERRPIDDAECIGGMLQHAGLNLLEPLISRHGRRQIFVVPAPCKHED